MQVKRIATATAVASWLVLAGPASSAQSLTIDKTTSPARAQLAQQSPFVP